MPSGARWEGLGVVCGPQQAPVGDQLVGEHRRLQESFVAAFALVGAAAATAIVLEFADGGFDSGMMPALPGPRGGGGLPLLFEGLFTRIGEAGIRKDLGEFGVIFRTVEATVEGDPLQVRVLRAERWHQRDRRLALVLAIGHDLGGDDESGAILRHQDAMTEFDRRAGLATIDQFGVRLEPAEEPVGQLHGLACDQAHPGDMGAGRQAADEVHHPPVFTRSHGLRDPAQLRKPGLVGVAKIRGLLAARIREIAQLAPCCRQGLLPIPVLGGRGARARSSRWRC